jgi:hypothetical protein
MKWKFIILKNQNNMPVNPNKNEREEDFISRCIGEEISAGYEQSQAAAICYSYWRKDKMSKITDTSEKVMARVKYDTDFKGINLFAEDGLEGACWEGYVAIGMKELDGRMVPNCVPETENMQQQGMEIDVLGYKTKNFTLCPGAVATFNHLMEMPLDEDTIGMVRSAAQVADNVFRIEKEVIQKGSATEEELKEAMILVGDFKDIMEEIDEEVMMQHDVSYMDGHIAKIESYL